MLMFNGGGAGGGRALNNYDKTKAPFDDRSTIKFMSTEQLEDQLSFKEKMGTVPDKNSHKSKG